MNIYIKCLKFFEETRPNNREVDYALLTIRIALGVFFISYGYSKLFAAAPGLQGFEGMLASNGFPLAGLFALLVGVAEFFGGIAILLGVFTRFSAFWLMIITFVAWWTIQGFSFGFQATGDKDLLALGMTIALLFTGPGAISLSGKMKKSDV